MTAPSCPVSPGSTVKIVSGPNKHHNTARVLRVQLHNGTWYLTCETVESSRQIIPLLLSEAELP
jgi:hypothetical protein